MKSTQQSVWAISGPPKRTSPLLLLVLLLLLLFSARRPHFNDPWSDHWRVTQWIDAWSSGGGCYSNGLGNTGKGHCWLLELKSCWWEDVATVQSQTACNSFQKRQSMEAEELWSYTNSEGTLIWWNYKVIQTLLMKRLEMQADYTSPAL